MKDLTKLETAVMKMTAAGDSFQSIATQLNRSLSTVETVYTRAAKKQQTKVDAFLTTDKEKLPLLQAFVKDFCKTNYTAKEYETILFQLLGAMSVMELGVDAEQRIIAAINRAFDK